VQPADARQSSSRALLFCGIAAALTLLVLIPYRIYEGGYLTHVSGAWGVLADDVAHGVLYRPLFSEIGYGGTRYFPLHFLLQGLLHAIGVPLRMAGHSLELAAGALLLYGAKLALKESGVSTRVAWTGAFLGLASRTAVMGLAGIRGDLFPVALGVLGLALIPRDGRLRASAVLFLALAVFAKPTLVWAPAGAVLAALGRRSLRQAVVWGASVGGLIGLLLLLANLASHGEMLRSFKACAGGGGASLSNLATGLALTRPGEMLWVLGGVALTLRRGLKAVSEPLCAAGLVCLPLTLVLLSGKGIHINHLVDASSLGALAVALAVATPSDWQRPARWLMAAATTLALAEVWLLDGMLHRHGELESVVAALPTTGGPILSEQPWIPLVAGERPYVLDAFALRLTRRTLPALDHDLLDKTASCYFRAVVLIGRAEKAPEWYDTVEFGPGFREALLEHYRFSRVVGGYPVYLPHCPGSPAIVDDPGPDLETIMDRGSRPSRIRPLLDKLLHH